MGLNLTKRLIDLGARVTVFDDFSTSNEAYLDGLQLRYIKGSVKILNSLDYAIEKSDAEIVFHLAARNIIICNKDPVDDFQTNAGGTLNVLLAARKHDVKRIVYTSSASVYGNPYYLPAREDATPDLLTPYAVSKYAGEGYCRAFYEGYGVPVSVVRYSNVYGPGQRPENPYCGVVAKFMESTLAGQPLDIRGDGEQTRDFTFIDDAVSATIAAATDPRAIGDVFNVGTGFETSVNKLAGFIISLNGSYIKPNYVECRDIDNIRRRAVNVDKARRVLRWTPRTTLRAGLLKTWEWMKANG